MAIVTAAPRSAALAVAASIIFFAPALVRRRLSAIYMADRIRGQKYFAPRAAHRPARLRLSLPDAQPYRKRSFRDAGARAAGAVRRVADTPFRRSRAAAVLPADQRAR